MEMNDQEEMVTIEEPTPEPAKEPTKLDQFIQRLSKYSNKDEAKAHITEIANELGCAKSLGYKAIKKVQFQGQTQERPQARELTAKIEPQEPEPLTEEQGQEEMQGEEIITETEEPAPPEVPITSKALCTSIELGFKKAAKLMDYPDLALTHEEAQSLADCWTPVLEYYAPQLSKNPIVWAVIGTAIILAPRTIGLIVEKINKRKQEKVIDVKPTKPPEETKPEPTPAPPETPLETPTLTENAQKEQEKPKTASFLAKL